MAKSPETFSVIQPWRRTPRSVAADFRTSNSTLPVRTKLLPIFLQHDGITAADEHAFLIISGQYFAGDIDAFRIGDSHGQESFCINAKWSTCRRFSGSVVAASILCPELSHCSAAISGADNEYKR